MPFGKFRGEDFIDVPTSYLVWLLENAHDIKAGLRQEIGYELACRFRPFLPAASRASGVPAPRAALRAALAEWHKRELRKWHPDKGGDVRVCQALNAAHDELTAILEETS